MRIWSLHPKYLDRSGLLACWRETLLAQKVLMGETLGYQNHPQLLRFRSQAEPLAAIGSYLTALAEEAERRGYHFDWSKVNPSRQVEKIPVTLGQLSYEWARLKKKIQRRDLQYYQQLAEIELPDPHPSFEIIEGNIEAWEKVKISS
jgi:Pyrimidine dimer DNA glycosylase